MTTSIIPTPILIPITHLAFGFNSNIIGGLPPLDCPTLHSTKYSSSISILVILVTLAGVNPVIFATSARDKLPLSLIILRTAETFICFISSKLPFTTLFIAPLLY